MSFIYLFVVNVGPVAHIIIANPLCRFEEHLQLHVCDRTVVPDVFPSTFLLEKKKKNCRKIFRKLIKYRLINNRFFLRPLYFHFLTLLRRAAISRNDSCMPRGIGK